MSNINAFRSLAGRGGDFAKANRYLVAFNVPQQIPNFTTYGPDQTYLCETAELPGRALELQDYRYYGPGFKMPTKSTYTDINFTLYVRSFMHDKRLFDNWMEYINPKTTYDFHFRRDYSTSINIYQFQETSSMPTYVVTLRNAYPINVNPMPLSWAEDNIHRLQVTFCYVDWRKSDDPTPTGTSTLDDYLQQLQLQAEQDARVAKERSI